MIFYLNKGILFSECTQGRIHDESLANLHSGRMGFTRPPLSGHSSSLGGYITRGMALWVWVQPRGGRTESAQEVCPTTATTAIAVVATATAGQRRFQINSPHRAGRGSLLRDPPAHHYLYRAFLAQKLDFVFYSAIVIAQTSVRFNYSMARYFPIKILRENSSHCAVSQRTFRAPSHFFIGHCAPFRNSLDYI